MQFTACVETHSQDRRLEKAPYWVCAYANNQRHASSDGAFHDLRWELGAELSENPAESSFHRALSVSQGTLSILDAEARVYSRIWCDYEVFVTLDKATWTAHLYDIYTFQNGSAVGITDGVALVDQRGKSWWWEDRKHQREKGFPSHLAAEAMKIQVQKGLASVELDRKRILNAIAGTELEAGHGTKRYACRT